VEKISLNADWFAQRPAYAAPTTEEPEPSAAPPGPPGRRSAVRGRLAAALLPAGLLVIALNLRIGVASVGPVLTSIRADLGLSATAASLLTTIPVVAFGAFAFLAPWLTRRLGTHQLLGLAMAALALGIGLRRQPSLASLFAGTVIIGAAIAIANVVMPAVVKHDFPRRVGPWMSVYSTALFLSAAVADGLTVPLLPLVGGHWRPALALWTIPAVAACLLWLPQFVRAPGRAGLPREAGGAPAEAVAPSFRAVLTDPVAIAVTAFMGVQSTGYYVTLAWLPTLLQDHGMGPHSAGWMLSYSAFPGIAAALASPALARRIRPAWALIAASVLCYAAAYAGLAVAPVRAAYLWMTLLGLGQGASISLSLSYIAWRSRDASHTAQVSTMAQGFGYLLASLGPVAIGAIRAASGSWTVPLAVLIALLVPQLVAGVLASRERQVLAPRESTATQPAGADEPMSAGEAVPGPWEGERDWFTPACGARRARPYLQHSQPATGGERHAGRGRGLIGVKRGRVSVGSEGGSRARCRLKGVSDGLFAGQRRAAAGGELGRGACRGRRAGRGDSSRVRGSGGGARGRAGVPRR
jgi:CP family cyanate transporter-like MFS transporter